jgi:hypothetical protein
VIEKTKALMTLCLLAITIIKERRNWISTTGMTAGQPTEECLARKAKGPGVFLYYWSTKTKLRDLSSVEEMYLRNSVVFNSAGSP